MNFTLRPWQPSDIESLAKYANNVNLTTFFTNRFPIPYTEKDAKNFIEIALNDKPMLKYAIEINGEAVGGIDFHPQADILCKNIEIGYWIGEPFWGKGIMTEVVKQIISIGFERFDVTRIYAKCFGKNIASQKVLENTGFKLEARFENIIYKYEVFQDELIYSVRKQ
jgi:RimJ/RimL family protein N-acetyltransferase